MRFFLLVLILYFPLSVFAADSVDIGALQRDADAGNAVAQVDLAMAYHDGVGGLAKSDTEAVKWFTKAAQQGDLEGQYNLAIAYYHGFGVEKNLTQAVTWFKKAAEQGLDQAQYILASAYQNGVGGLPRDLVQTHYWLSLAEAQGNKEASRERITLESDMSEDQIAASKLLLSAKNAQMTPRPTQATPAVSQQ
jgi:uncharacterized protein